MEEKIKILLCEDDENLGMLLREYLQAKGFTTVLCPDGEVGYKEFNKNKFDIAVLDVMMPKKDGFTLAQEIRQTNADLPIIFLTARDTENDTVTGFNIGADDYISKPFSIREVMVRVRAVLRRTAEQAGDADESKIINYQGLQLNLDKKTVSIDGEAIPFTKTEFELLRLFLEERGKVFSRQELIDRVWPKDVMVLDRTVDVNITRMRKKIGKFAKCIVTRLGFGYYFDA